MKTKVIITIEQNGEKVTGSYIAYENGIEVDKLTIEREFPKPPPVPEPTNFYETFKNSLHKKQMS